MNEYEPIIEILDDILGEHRLHNEYKGQITYCCPTCSYDIKGLDEPDGKFNLEINYKLGIYHCWVCGETHNTHGNIHKLVKKFGSKNQYKQFKMFYPENDEFYVKPYVQVKLPKEFISFETATNGLKMTHFYKQAYNYLKSRNITDDIIKKFNIGFCYDGEYKNRIIIPSYDINGEVNYFVARSYESKPYMKYKNPEAQKEIIIFNELYVDWNKPIYLVEGVFDSIFLDNAIPMLGKSLSSYLFEVLYKNAKKIIIVLDPDAYDNEVKIYNTLNGGRLMDNIYMTHLTGDKDIADLCGDLTNFPPFKLE